MQKMDGFVSIKLDLIEQHKANQADVLLSVDRSSINIQTTDGQESIPLISPGLFELAYSASYG